MSERVIDSIEDCKETYGMPGREMCTVMDRLVRKYNRGPDDDRRQTKAEDNQLVPCKSAHFCSRVRCWLELQDC